MPLPMYRDHAKEAQRSIKHIIAVAAGKGGVGKSTVTANLALALKLLGYSVGILDADVYGPSMRKMLPEQQMPKQEEGGKIVPASSYGIRMISMAYFRPAHQAASVRAPIANGIINQFISEVEWGQLDYLLIDFPPGTGDVQLTLGQKASLSGALMVTTPQEVALLDVRKAIHLFEQQKIPIIGVIENMSYYYHPATKEKISIFGNGGGERLAKEYQVPFLGGIAIDPILSDYGDHGKSIFQGDDPRAHDATVSFMRLAKQLAASTSSVAEGSDSFELVWEEK